MIELKVTKIAKAYSGKVTLEGRNTKVIAPKRSKMFSGNKPEKGKIYLFDLGPFKGRPKKK